MKYWDGACEGGCGRGFLRWRYQRKSSPRTKATKRKDPTMIPVFCPTLKAEVENEGVGVEVDAREGAGELDPL